MSFAFHRPHNGSRVELNPTDEVLGSGAVLLIPAIASVLYFTYYVSIDFNIVDNL